jgi:putative ABC transport system ATP-binding protein
MIELLDITKIYRMGNLEVPALRGVNLQIEKGEVVAIMGPSGSGKSTLMNILGCLDKPTSGSYRLEGIKVGNLSDDELAWNRNRKIGFIFQSFNLLPHLTALENVELALILRGEKNRHRQALEALERVGLSDRIHHKPSKLSGGQQQRVAIARALIQRPDIILADEPTGNLDRHSSEAIMGLLDQLNQQSKTIVIIVTHDQRVSSHARRVIQIEDGTIVNGR